VSKRAAIKSKYDLDAAWSYLLSIKEGDGQYGFQEFFTNKPDRVIAAFLLAEAQPNGVYGLFCEDFFVEEIDTKKPVEGMKCLQSVFNDILSRTGEWK
jgi:hypothetical protein